MCGPTTQRPGIEKHVSFSSIDVVMLPTTLTPQRPGIEKHVSFSSIDVVMLPTILTTQRPGIEKHVSFSSIDVVMLPMILGDHPACKEGPPVQPCWEESSRHVFSIEDFEKNRLPYRRPSTALYLTSLDRSRILSPENDNDNGMKNIETQRIEAPKSELILRKEHKERLEDRLAESEMRRVFLRARRVNERVDGLVSRIELRQRKLYERRRRRLERKLPRTLSVIHQNQPTNPAA
jgi:hypothetical protein